MAWLLLPWAPQSGAESQELLDNDSASVLYSGPLIKQNRDLGLKQSAKGYVVQGQGHCWGYLRPTAPQGGPTSYWAKQIRPRRKAMIRRTAVLGALALIVFLVSALDRGFGQLPAISAATSATTLPQIAHAKAESVEGSKPGVLRDYGRLPLYFEPNQGLTDQRVQYLSHGRGYTLFLTPGEATLVLHRGTSRATLNHALPHLQQNKGSSPSIAGSEAGSQDDKTLVVRMKLAGANGHPRVNALEELSGKANYFIGNDPTKWRTNVPMYAKVKYEVSIPAWTSYITATSSSWNMTLS